MAYGNYGAFVYRNGQRMTRWEDQTPYKEQEFEPGYHQAFKSGQDGYDAYHAVLGEKRVRLCGYKESPALFLDGIRQNVEELCCDPDDLNCHFAGELEGYTWAAIGCNGNMIGLFLREPDGTIWTATCGYDYGAGHD